MKTKPIPPKEIYIRRPRGRIPADVKAWLEVNEHWTGWEIAVCSCGKWYDQMDYGAPYHTEMNWCKKCGYESPTTQINPKLMQNNPKKEIEVCNKNDDDNLDELPPVYREREKMLEMFVGSHGLAKACLDQDFDYALKLRTGEVIAFRGAELLNPEWIHVRIKPMDEQPTRNQIAYPAERGMDIRISDIVWVMDAPEGS